MGLLSAISYSGNSSRVVTGNGQQARGGAQRFGQNLWRRAMPAEDRERLHPNREWSPQEVIYHLVEVHHKFFRESLNDLTSLLEKCVSLATVRQHQWEVISQRFRKLRDTLQSGIQFEELAVFPELLHRQPYAPEFASVSELLDAAKTVERSHALCLQMLWRLLRLTRDELEISTDDLQYRQFAKQLAALCDDYEQHLFEEECLLLPKFFSCRSPASQRLREPNESDYLDGDA